MSFQYTYRHVHVSPSLTQFAEARFVEVGKLLHKESRWHVYFSMGRYDYAVEVVVQGAWGHFKASCRAGDFYEAVDLAAKKLERQFQKRKEQHQHHRKPELSRSGQLEHVNEALEYIPFEKQRPA